MVYLHCWEKVIRKNGRKWSSCSKCRKNLLDID